jgi:hypothetical protein
VDRARGLLLNKDTSTKEDLNLKKEREKIEGNKIENHEIFGRKALGEVPDIQSYSRD